MHRQLIYSLALAIAAICSFAIARGFAEAEHALPEPVYPKASAEIPEEYILMADIPTADTDTLVYCLLLSDDRADLALRELIKRRGDPDVIAKLRVLDNEDSFLEQCILVNDEYKERHPDILFTNEPVLIRTSPYIPVIETRVQSALFALGEQSDIRFDYLVEQVLTTDGSRRADAGLGLQSMNPEEDSEYVDRLAPAFSQNKDADNTDRLLYILGNYPTNNTAHDLVMKTLVDDDTENVQAAIWAIGRWPDINPAFECDAGLISQLEAFTDSENTELQATAYSALGNGYGDCPGIEDYLLDSYNNSDCPERFYALMALTDLLSTDEFVSLAISEIESCSCGIDASVWIMTMLGRIGPEARGAAPALRRIAYDDCLDSYYRFTAQHTLDEILEKPKPDAGDKPE